MVLASTHEVDGRDFNERNGQTSQNLEFHMSKLEPMFIQYEDPEEVSRYQQDLFLSGLFLGIGLPTFISSWVELLRERQKSTEVRHAY